MFDYKIPFWICGCVLWMHVDYFVLKKEVNVSIKAFWYTKNNDFYFTEMKDLNYYFLALELRLTLG